MLYYMLNPKDITECYGIVDEQDVMDELNITKSQFKNLLKCQYDYYHNSILVEVAPDVDRKKNNEKFDEVLFYTSEKGMRFYACSDCTIKRINKQGKVFFCKITKRYGCYKTQIDYHIVNAGRIFAKIFIKPDLKADEVVVVDGDLKLENMRVLQKKDFLSEKQKKIRKKRVGYFVNGELIKSYQSTVECARDLYFTSNHIQQICTHKYKKPAVDVRYLD